MTKRIILFSISIFLLFGLFSCSDINSGEISYKDSYIPSELRVSLSIYCSDSIFSNAAKTLLPASLNGKSLNYYLFYINTAVSISSSDYSYYGKIDLTYSSSNLATASVDFSASVYRFALFATEANLDSPSYSAVKDSACLLGYSTADLYSTKTVSFHLTSNSLNSSGSVDISLTSSWSFPSDWDFSDSKNAIVSVGIYDLLSGEAISLGANLNPHYLSYSSEISNTVHFSNYTFGNAQIPAGTYSFVIKFINLNSGKTFEYSDTISILANQTTCATVDIPNVINIIPSAPIDFEVSYTDPDNNEMEYYVADFNWVDKSNNETGFEIQIADISCGFSNISGNSGSLLIPDLSSDFGWEFSVSNAAYPADNVTTYNSESYNDYISYYYAYFGTSDYDPNMYSLIRNNTTAKFYFQLGKRYIARIRAVNDVGGSQWTYAVFDGGNCASINRYRISYSMKNGLSVSYASQDASGVSVMASVEDDWLAWYRDVISYDSNGNFDNANKYPMTDGISCDLYTGHENLNLIGAYEEVDTPSDYAWADYDLILYGVTDTASAVYLDELSETDNKCENGQVVTVSKTNVASFVWTLADTVKDYERVTLNIASTKDLSANIVSVLWDVSTKMWTTPISDLETGTYIATLNAEKNSANYVFTVVLKIEL
ncbi:MAG: hypothetical protein IJ530_08520 [Treponema sp.]|uniref:hypothetical protein n=1 Tax=Treponema sp. TaxID=166 RepID=UPI0025F0DF2C|nr:hypothetical protein [Treponema sp.]MBQ8679796.1 hypothetical protein [Treponema sp.]